MEIPPYGPFEKAKDPGSASSSGLIKSFTNAVINKEELFKNYNELSLDDPDGQSKFRYIDRVRVLYTIILDTIDLSEL
jgi:hypothetical protein